MVNITFKRSALLIKKNDPLCQICSDNADELAIIKWKLLDKTEKRICQTSKIVTNVKKSLE